MSNDRLREALNRAGYSPETIAETMGVDPKTVQRWISQDRVPYRRHRTRLVTLLAQSETYLWPATRSDANRRNIVESEVVEVYPRRCEIHADTWMSLIQGAERHIDVMVYDGLFLPEQYPHILEALPTKFDQGTQIRFLLGDPQSAAVQRRGQEEGIGDALSLKVLNALSLFRPMSHSMQLRLHETTLYNSVFRFDDDLLVNPHVLGRPDAHNPALHLRLTNGGNLFGMYMDAFENVWKAARPVPPSLANLA